MPVYALTFCWDPKDGKNHAEIHFLKTLGNWEEKSRDRPSEVTDYLGLHMSLVSWVIVIHTDRQTDKYTYTYM